MKTIYLLFCLLSGLSALCQDIYDTLLTLGGTSGGAVDGRWTNSGNIQFLGGLVPEQWVAQDVLAGTYTSLQEGPFNQVQTPGTITRIDWWCNATDASDKAYKVMLMRAAATNVYTVVYVSDSQTATAGVTNSVTVAWDCLEGDRLGWWASDIDTTINLRNDFATFELQTRYKLGEAALGAGYTSGASPAGAAMHLAAYGYGPAILYTGDSIITGYPNYIPFLGEFLDVGLASNSVPWAVKNQQGITASYVDAARPSTTAETLNLYGMFYATNRGAKLGWLHVGVNDIYAGVSWSNFETNIIAIRNKFGTNKPFFIAEILPATAASEANALTARIWNTNLSYWASTNFATLVRMHDAFGVTRGATGQLDDLNPIYVLPDNTHLSVAGIAEYARWVKTNITALVR